jgi:type I restriction enzyme S subunit
LIPLAPRPEQRRIVERIGELFAEIAEGEAALAEARRGLDLFRRSLMKAAVTGELTREWRSANTPVETGAGLLARVRSCRPSSAREKVRGRRAADVTGLTLDNLSDIPATWAWTALGEITEIVGGVTVDQKRKPEDPITVPYLRVANVQRGHIDLSEIKTIIVERSTAARLELLDGDILLNEGGDRDKIGRGWVWDGSIRGMIHQNHVFRARPHCDGVNPFFVSHYANEMGRRFFMEQGKQTTNLASISLTKLSQLPVPLPPAAETSKILTRLAEGLDAADDAAKELDDEAADAARLKQSILKAAFEGRLVPQDPADEPASTLLARLTTGAFNATRRRRRVLSTTS